MTFKTFFQQNIKVFMLPLQPHLKCNIAQISCLVGCTIFNHLLNVSVPQFKLYGHEMSQTIANDKRDYLNPSTMIKIAKNNQVVFKSFAEPLNDGQIPIQSNCPDLTAILTLLALCLAGTTTCLLVYLFAKVLKLSCFVLVFQLSQQAKALAPTLPFFFSMKLLTGGHSFKHGCFPI